MVDHSAALGAVSSVSVKPTRVVSKSEPCNQGVKLGFTLSDIIIFTLRIPAI